MPTKKPISDEWKVDVNKYSFFDQMWDDWMPVTEITPVDPAEYDAWLSDDNADTSTKPTDLVTNYDPLDAEGLDNVTRDAISSFRSWGQGPVLAAMKGLDIFEVNNREDSDSVLDWLSENYDSIFEDDGTDDSIPSIPEYVYEAKEMDISYTPKYSDAMKTKRFAYGGVKHNVNADFDLAFLSSPTNSLYDL
tara:strand:- start:4001 stop:4576 length:576 start_codon:yes stop_codon:yes gene_type:complete